MKAVLAGVGGFIGSAARYLLGHAITVVASNPVFPLATTLINILGCLIIGVLAGLAETHQIFGESMRVFVFIGILGGFTTFSTFGYETVQLARDGRYSFALLNIAVQVGFGCLAVWSGLKLAKAF